jgi:hypothetical protein
MSWTWKWFDLMIVLGALVLGFAVFFLPSFENSKGMKEAVAAEKQRKAALAAYEARQAETKREQEELGLVFLSPEPQQSQQQKPAPKQDK